MENAQDWRISDLTDLATSSPDIFCSNGFIESFTKKSFSRTTRQKKKKETLYSSVALIFIFIFV